MRILVCEDQDSIRNMIMTLVKASGHDVIAVPSGAKAVELVLTERIDMLLLDLMMPGALDGFAVCERLRKEESTKDVPIFIISAMDDAASRQRALDAGATGFYGKPFRPLVLLQQIKEIAAQIAQKKADAGA